LMVLFDLVHHGARFRARCVLACRCARPAAADAPVRAKQGQCSRRGDSQLLTSTVIGTIFIQSRRCENGISPIQTYETHCGSFFDCYQPCGMFKAAWSLEHGENPITPTTRHVQALKAGLEHATLHKRFRSYLLGFPINSITDNANAAAPVLIV